MTDTPEPPIEFQVTSTLDDTVAVTTYLSSPAKAAKRRRAWRGPAIFVMFLLVGLGGGLLTGDNPAEAMKLLLTTSFALQAIVIVLLFLATAWLAGHALRLVNRRTTRAVHADIRRGHPAVDGRDPTLALARRYRFDESGMTMSTDFDEVWEAWPRLTGLDETPHLLIVRVGAGVGYPLPKSQMTEELRERLHLYIAARSHSKWPF